MGTLMRPTLDMPELEVHSKSTKYKACLVELKTQIYNKASAMCSIVKQ